MKPPNELLKLEIVPVIGGYAIKKDVSQLEDESAFLGRYDTVEEAQKVLSLVQVVLFACDIVSDVVWSIDELKQALLAAGCTDD